MESEPFTVQERRTLIRLLRKKADSISAKCVVTKDRRLFERDDEWLELFVGFPSGRRHPTELEGDTSFSGPHREHKSSEDEFQEDLNGDEYLASDYTLRWDSKRERYDSTGENEGVEMGVRLRGDSIQFEFRICVHRETPYLRRRIKRWIEFSFTLHPKWDESVDGV